MTKHKHALLLALSLIAMLVSPILAEETETGSDDTPLMEEVLKREEIAEREPKENIKVDAYDDELMYKKEGRRSEEMTQEEQNEENEELMVPYWY